MELGILLLVGFLLAGLCFADEPGAAPAPAASPAPSQEPVTVKIGNEVFDENRIRRNHEQAGQVPKLLDEIKALREQVKTLPTPTSPPAPPAEPAEERVLTEAELDQLVDARVAQNLSRQDAARQVQIERETAISAMSQLELAPADATNPKTQRMLIQVDQLLNTGIPGPDGKIIPGSAAVDDKGKPVPATKAQIDKAVEYLAQEISSDGQKIRQKKLGPKPDAPPATSSGQAVSGIRPDTPMLKLNPEDRRARIKEYLAHRKAAGSGGSASGSGP